MGISNPLNMLAQGEEIYKLIPQRPPIVMVDKLISAEDKKTVSGFSINKDNIFVSEGVLREPGIIENIAQSAALGVGYVCSKNNEAVPIGFIGAITNLQIMKLPEVNTELLTEIFIEYEVLGATLIRSKVFCEKNLIAQAEMKIFLKINS
ncbi:MAG: hydroxymyristoyl-ACP dehydratase [Bacteroidales bacterium]|jgi:predicted hotdog family 3-hydroxylacyl-ACP dehydratase|nr:hydroxymyristoyl-ACP dehydratase [Bacteroidales bacterium]MDD4215355.1 hydroxymyristoyl-ACP dehydratase [Bacteroidales bacterium]